MLKVKVNKRHQYIELSGEHYGWQLSAEQALNVAIALIEAIDNVKITLKRRPVASHRSRAKRRPKAKRR